MLVVAAPAFAQSEKRIAFVVGIAAYPAAPPATAANDAGLIAQTLQAAGFDVSGARDLDGESLRAAFRDFLDKAQASEPDMVAFAYLARYEAPQGPMHALLEAKDIERTSKNYGIWLCSPSRTLHKGFRSLYAKPADVKRGSP